MHDPPKFPSQRVETTSATEAVVKRILELIETGALGPGSQLPSEEELSAAFGVGRSSVREAKRLLAARGLLDSRVGVGTFVCEVSVDEAIPPEMLRRLLSGNTLEALHEARDLLEMRCAELAVERADEEDLAGMAHCLQMMADDVNNGRPAYRFGLRFHAALVSATHNPVFERFYEVLADLLWTYQAPMSDPQRQLDEQRSLFAAIQRRDHAETTRLMRQHLDFIREHAAPAA